MLVKNTGIESSRKKPRYGRKNRLLGDHTRGMVDHRPTPVSVRPAWVRSTEHSTAMLWGFHSPKTVRSANAKFWHLHRISNFRQLGFECIAHILCQNCATWQSISHLKLYFTPQLPLDNQFHTKTATRHSISHHNCHSTIYFTPKLPPSLYFTPKLPPDTLFPHHNCHSTIYFTPILPPDTLFHTTTATRQSISHPNYHSTIYFTPQLPPDTLFHT
jgi:hypothetical protein